MKAKVTGGLVFAICISHSSAWSAQTEAHLGPTMSLEQSDLEYLQRARLDQIPDLEVEFDARGIPRELRGQLGFYFGEKPDLELRRLLSDLGPACRAANTESLKQFTSQVNRVGIAVYRIGEFINDIPVIGAGLIIVTDYNTGQITRIKGSFLPDRDLSTDPKISSEQSIEYAAEAIAANSSEQLPEREVSRDPELVYMVDGHLAWRMVIIHVVEENSQETEEVILTRLTVR
jgi:hypothetical protein